jgi:hypothetical protein
VTAAGDPSADSAKLVLSTLRVGKLDDRLAHQPHGRVECRRRLFQRPDLPYDGAQATIAYPLRYLSQLPSIGLDDEEHRASGIRQAGR